MKHILKILKGTAMMGVCAGMVACATKPKHSFSMETNAETEEKNITALRDSLNAEQMDVLSPVHFKKGEKALKEAREDIADKKDRTEILNDLQQAKDQFEAAKVHGEQWRAELAPAVLAREKTVAAGVHNVFPKDLRAIDDELTDITEEKFETGEHNREAARLQKRYMDLELRTTQRNALHGAREMVKTARDEGARRYASESLEKTELSILNADRQIEANRNNPEAYKDAVAVANASARELLAVTRVSKDARGKTPEQIALEIRNQQKQLEAKDLQANAALKQVDALAATNVAQGAAIASQTQELKAANATIATEQEMQAKLKEIEDKFSKSEADVYRQGGSVVVRLKSMQFKSSKADLPAASLPVLAKVKSIMDDLQAQKVVVEGHTDSVGGAEINKKISEDRAEAVSKYLTAEAGEKIDVETVGYGFDRPLATNKTASGRAENRRVDIVITPSRVE